MSVLTLTWILFGPLVIAVIGLVGWVIAHGPELGPTPGVFPPVDALAIYHSGSVIARLNSEEPTYQIDADTGVGWEER